MGATDNRHQKMIDPIFVCSFLIHAMIQGQRHKQTRIERKVFYPGLNQKLSTLKTARPQDIEGVTTGWTGLLPRRSKMERYLSFPNSNRKTTPPRTLGEGPNAIKCYYEEIDVNLDRSFMISPERPQISSPSIILPPPFIKHSFMSRQWVT